MDDLVVREIPVTDWAMIERIDQLRVRVYREEIPQAAGLTSMLDEFDPIARHWVVLQNNQPVAAARLSIHRTLEELPDPENYRGVFTFTPPAPIASFNRLVIDSSVRGTGISTQLDLIRLDAAESMGCKSALGATAAGERRIRQMLVSGFEVVGTGNQDLHLPWSYLPPPVILICRLPRQKNLDN